MKKVRRYDINFDFTPNITNKFVKAHPNLRLSNLPQKIEK